MSLYDRIVLEGKDDPFGGIDFAMFDLPKKEKAPGLPGKWKWKAKGKPPRALRMVCPDCGYEKDIPFGVAQRNPKLNPHGNQWRGVRCPKCKGNMYWDSTNSPS